MKRVSEVVRERSIDDTLRLSRDLKDRVIDNDRREEAVMARGLNRAVIKIACEGTLSNVQLFYNFQLIFCLEGEPSSLKVRFLFLKVLYLSFLCLVRSISIVVIVSYASK